MALSSVLFPFSSTINAGSREYFFGRKTTSAIPCPVGSSSILYDHSEYEAANPMSFCLRRRTSPLLPRSSERILPQVSILSKDFHLRTDIKKEPCNSKVPCGIRQRPTLPGRLQPSTIGAERLNFCVRYGNRWIPFAVATGNLTGFVP